MVSGAFLALHAAPGENPGGAVLQPLGPRYLFEPCTQGSVPCRPGTLTSLSPRLFALRGPDRAPRGGQCRVLPPLSPEGSVLC